MAAERSASLAIQGYIVTPEENEVKKAHRRPAMASREYETLTLRDQGACSRQANEGQQKRALKWIINVAVRHL
jgi:hypothetical protein